MPFHVTLTADFYDAAGHLKFGDIGLDRLQNVSGIEMSRFAEHRPEIGADQGSQFTRQEFTERLAVESIAISMDGKGRAIDNVMIERLWRTVKYENIYLKEYTSGADCHQGLQAYFQYYCHERPHQSLSSRTPWHACQTARRSSR